MSRAAPGLPADPDGPGRLVTFEGSEYRLPASIPRHVAFIMDGNGRWARARGLPRIRGHQAGAEALRRVTRFCRSIGVGEITFFALSTENFRKRPRHEIRVLMRLLRSYLRSERSELIDTGIRLRSIGRTAELPAAVRATLEETIAATAAGDRMVLRLALNYGGRQEIIDGISRLLAEQRAGEAPSPPEEETFRRLLYDASMPDPDLLVRTAGELRLSNFLLWQCSYTELWVSPRMWPDFDAAELVRAFESFGSRERKYGAVGAAQDAVDPSDADLDAEEGPEDPARPA